MAGSAGSVYVDLLLRDGRYRQGLKQSRDYTKRWSGQISGDTKKAESAFAQVLNPVSNLEAGVLRLGATVAAALSVSQIINYSDTWKQLQGRLGLVVDGTAELASVNQQLSDIAERTRQPLESIVNLYARMGQMIPENVRGNLDLLAITEGVSTALAITGESSLSAQAAIIQFTQALSTNFEAAGQELRSIQEQAPRLALALKNSFGDGTKSLKELVETGILTNETLGEVFRPGQKEFDKLISELKRIDPTVRNAFTILNNEVLQFVGNSKGATDAAKALADGVKLIANNLELIAKALKIGALALTLRTLDSGVSKIVSGFVAGRVVGDFSNDVKDLRTQTGSLLPVTAKTSNELITFNSNILTATKSTNALTASKKVFSDVSKSNNAVLGSSLNFFQHLTGKQDMLTVSSKNLSNTGKLLESSWGAGGAAKSFKVFSERAALVDVQFANFSKSVPLAVGSATKQFSLLEKSGLLVESVFKRVGLGLKSLFFAFGPLNVAILGLGTAYVFLKDRMSEAEKIAEKYPKLFAEISDAADKGTDSINNVAGENAKKSLRELKNEIEELEKAVSKIGKSDFENTTVGDRLKNIFSPNLLDEARLAIGLFEIEVRKGNLSSEEIGETVEDLIIKFPTFEKSILNSKKEMLSLVTAATTLNEKLGLLPETMEAVIATNNNFETISDEWLQKIKNVAKGGTLNSPIPPSKTGKNAEAIDKSREKFLNRREEEAQRRREKAQQAAITATRELNSLYRSNREYITGMTREEIARADKLEELEKLLGTKFIPTQEKLNEAIKRYDESLQDNKENVNQWGIDISEVGKNAAESIQDAFADFLFDPFENGVGGMAEQFEKALRRMVAEALAADLMRSLFGNDNMVGLFGTGGKNSQKTSSTGGISEDGVFSFIGDFFAGFRANGGPIPAGQFAVVGERGPELAFGGSVGKTIMPFVGGSGSNVNVTVINNGNNNVSTRETQTANGMDIQVMIDESVAQKIATPGSRTNRALNAYSNRGLVKR